jgi:hypothetical protein
VRVTQWSSKTFGDDLPPTVRTIQGWDRKGMICPSLVKIGKAYYVREDAVILSGKNTLLDKIMMQEIEQENKVSPPRAGGTLAEMLGLKPGRKDHVTG